MPPDRDQTVERLLKRALRTRDAPATDAPCLDAETMAAWVDGGLTASEISLTEAHLAQCARCQAIVAAIARAAPPIPIAARWWQRHWGLGWLVPVTVSLAAVVLWIAVPRENPSVPKPRDAVAESSESARGREALVSPTPAAGAVGLVPRAPENGRQRPVVDSKASLEAARPDADEREIGRAHV